MNKVSFIRNIKISVKNDCTWLFLESNVCEAAGLVPGDMVKMTEEKRALIFTKSEDGDHVVSKCKRSGWAKERTTRYFWLT